MPKSGFAAIQCLRARTTTNRGGSDKKDDILAIGTALAIHAEAYLDYLRMLNRTTEAIEGRESDLRCFLRWATPLGLNAPTDFTASLIESYQRSLWAQRKPDGRPLAVTTQRTRLGAVQQFFGWLCRQHVLTANPTSCMELPKSPNALPFSAPTVGQVQKILKMPDTADPLGVRDRAILELFYSTGIRRSEMAHLEISDLCRERRLLRITMGKGRKDRVVPVGRRAMHWVDRYLAEVRPRLLIRADEQALFLSGYGERLNTDVLGRKVSDYIRSASVPTKAGAHSLRRACATHMLEGGADIRYIQQLLGHAKLETTAIYAEVTIIQLQVVHAKCHPAERHYRSPAGDRAAEEAVAAAFAACEGSPS